MKTHKIGIKTYLKNHKLGISLYILVNIIASACSIFQTLLFADIIVEVNDMVINHVNASYYTAIYTLCFIIGLVIIKRSCWFATGYIYQKVAHTIMAELNYDLSRQAFKLNSKTYNDHNTGTFVQRLISDPEQIVNYLADMVDMITDIITSSIIIIYVTTLNIYIGAIIITLVVIGIVIENFRVKKRMTNRRDTRAKNDKVNALSTEIVKSEKDIKSLGLEEKLSEVAKKYYEDYKYSSYKTEMTDMKFWAARNYLIEIVGIAILILGAFLLRKEIIVPATFMLVYSNDGRLYNLIWSCGSIMTRITNMKICSERMFGLFDENEFVTEKFGNTHLENVKGVIEFKNVDYSYIEYEQHEYPKKMTRKEYKKLKNNPPPRIIKNKNHIFENLSFKIEPNTTVAFVGRSGSGKSTILNLMSKMYEVDGGEVLIDNVNINDLDKDTLRRTISLVNQFPYIFDMTIKENLLLAKKDATDEEINEAIKSSSLAEFVSLLPDGLNTKVGESGIKLSGGQKQRLAIARALLRNSPIIIFDESTSSLDNFAQEEIKQSIDALKGKSTVVIVAHRLTTIRDADKIFFLDQGKIEDIGTFDELFNNNIKFKNMFYAEKLG